MIKLKWIIYSFSDKENNCQERINNPFKFKHLV